MPLENDSQPLLCRCCEKEVALTDDFCPSCGFPLKGTEAEQGKFIGQYILNDSSSFGNDIEIAKQVKNARTTLFVVAGLTVLGGLLMVAMNTEGQGIWELVVSLIVAGIFIALASWSNKNPFAAILTGLIIYISLILLDGILDPVSIVKGIIVKIIIISYMVKGVMGASKARNKA